MINPIRTDGKRNNPGALTLPSLNEVFKQDNTPPMYSPNNMMPYPKTAPFTPTPISPSLIAPQNARGPVPPPPKQPIQPIQPLGALHSLLNPLPPGGKQSITNFANHC